MDANQLVMDTLRKMAKPMKSGEIAEATGVDKKEVDKVIKKLKTANLITSPKACFYEIKNQ